MRLAHLAAIVESSQDAIIGFDLDSTVTSWNHGAERLYDYTEADVLGRPATMLMLPQRSQEIANLLARVCRGERVAPHETMRRRANGTRVDVSTTVSPIRDERGDVVGVSAFERDITERKGGEEALQQMAWDLKAKNDDLRQAISQAEQADHAKSEFLANMSHEIRTPLTAILGYADVVAENVTNPEDIGAVATIRRNGEHLLNIINDILDLSKIESGKYALERIECSPYEIIKDVIDLMQVRADAKGLKLKSQYEGLIPETIRTDPLRLRQILINLVGNSIKFTEAGDVNLVVRLVDSDGIVPKLEFDVVDEGIGMNSEQMTRLFEPFMQADTSTTRVFGGTGLGLAVSHRLAQLLQGDITPVCVLGQGCTFRLMIPTNSDRDVKLIDHTLQEEATPVVVAPAAANSQQPLEGLRILLVEDGPDNQRLISFLLRKAGADVTVAEDGQAGIDRVQEAEAAANSYDVIFMDMQMPVLDGYAATRQFRTDAYARPIIALTAHAMSGDRRKCLAAGCDEYLTKPIDRNKLINTAAEFAQRGLSEAVTCSV